MRWIARTLERAGFETWTVGGAVRDALLGLAPGDWDVTTRARPGDVQRLFRRTVPLGVEHGTVGVLSDDGTMFEVTTFRRDVETDGRHAVVAFADRVEDDLARRDFTFNAIAWHPLRQEMLDPFGGVRDLDARLLRAVGVPQERFAEDGLRVLRAMRFAGRFDLRIDPDTWTAMRGAVGKLPSLSAERIREELLKILGGDRSPSTALDLYRASGALGALYPPWAALVEADEPRWVLALRTVDALPPGRPLLRLAVLLRPLETEDAAQILVSLKLSNAQMDETARHADAAPLPAPDRDDATVRRWLAGVGAERVSAVARMDLAEARVRVGEGGTAPEDVVRAWRRVRAVLATHPPLTVSDLAVDGRDLIRLGLRPGPLFGRILDGLLDWVLDDPERNRVAALREQALVTVNRLERSDG